MEKVSHPRLSDVFELLAVSDEPCAVISLESFDCHHLPFAHRVLLESSLRHRRFEAAEKILARATDDGCVQIQFSPTRLLLQGFSGLSALLDLACLRDAAKREGKDPSEVQPKVAVDILLDHAQSCDLKKVKTPVNKTTTRPTPASASLKRGDVPVASASPGNAATPKYLPPHLRGRSFNSRPPSPSSSASSPLCSPEELEWKRNKERHHFFKWCQQSFHNINIIPPGIGLPHQVYLEYTTDVLCFRDGTIFPETVLGTDTHTSVLNGLGVLGLTTGAIECEAALLKGELTMDLPKVVGIHLKGNIDDVFVTSTDITIAIIKCLKSAEVSAAGKVVEFFGVAVKDLSVCDRMVISQMCPEAGALAAFFPFDLRTAEYLEATKFLASSPERLAALRHFRQKSGLFQDHSHMPRYDRVIEFDLSSVLAHATGPRGSSHRVPLRDVKADFARCLTEEAGHRTRGFGVSPVEVGDRRDVSSRGGEMVSLGHGSVVFASIAAYTNASYPSVLLASGLLAKNAFDKGLKLPSHMETCLKPGSGMVDFYRGEVVPSLESLGFKLSVEAEERQTYDGNLILASVASAQLSRDEKRASYIVYPPLVVAFALAGRVSIDFETDPIGNDADGKPIFIKDIWPSREEVQEVEIRCVRPFMLKEAKSKLEEGNIQWTNIEVNKSLTFRWDGNSTSIQRPRFLDSFSLEAAENLEVRHGLVIAFVGDGIGADHVSLAGSIERESPAAQYLLDKGLRPRDFNSYGSRCGNDEVMVRGTFAHPKLENKMSLGKGPKTLHIPSNTEMPVFDAARRYNPNYRQGVISTPLIVLAGKDYGKGSSREWAVKGPWLLGVRAVLAESIHRSYCSSLLEMGILPLLFDAGESAASLGLTGRESYSIVVEDDGRGSAEVLLNDGRHFKAFIQTPSLGQLETIRQGGMIPETLRQLVTSS